MPELRLPNRVHHLVEETGQNIDSARRRLVTASRGALHMPRDEAERLLQRGENLFDRLVERGEQIEKDQMKRFAGWRRTWERRSHRQIEAVEDRIEAVQERVEDQVRAALEALHIPDAGDLKRLDKEIDRISARLDAQLAQARTAALPIAGYEEMTVKEAGPLLDGLDRQQLLDIRAFETENRNRVTILRHVDRRLEQLGQDS